MSEKNGILSILSKGSKSAGGSTNPLDNPAKKNVGARWALASFVVLGVLFALSTALGQKEQVVESKGGSSDKQIEINPASLEDKTWQSTSQERISTLISQNEKLNQRLALLESNAKEAQKAAPPPPTFDDQKKTDAGQSQGSAQTGATPAPNGQTASPQPSTPQVNSNQPEIKIEPPAEIPGSGIKVPTTKANAIPPAVVESAEEQRAASVPKEPVTPKQIGPKEIKVIPLSSSGQYQYDSGKILVKETIVKNNYAGYLPEHSRTKAVLLTGVSAGTSQVTQSNPIPLLLEMLDTGFITPGGGRYQTSKCTIMASASGDMSSGRVNGRLTRLSCFDKSNKLLIASPIEGYLVDGDGEFGLRGVLERRNGAALANTVLASLAQGMATAFGNANTTVTSNLTSGVSTTFNGEDTLKAAGFGAAQKATDFLAQYYMKEANSIFPVIRVNSGRVVDIVITAGQTLEWYNTSGRYMKQYVPVGQ